MKLLMEILVILSKSGAIQFEKESMEAKTKLKTMEFIREKYQLTDEEMIKVLFDFEPKKKESEEKPS